MISSFLIFASSLIFHRALASENKCFLQKHYVSDERAAIVGGRLFQLLFKPGGPGARELEERDFKGNVLRKVTLPRPIDFIVSYKDFEGGLIYNAQGRMYHFNFEKNKEVDLSVFNTGNSRRSKDMWMNNTTAYSMASQSFYPIENGNDASFKEGLLVYPRGKKDNGVFQKFTILNPKTGERVHLEGAGFNGISIKGPNHISALQYSNNVVSRTENFFKLGEKWISVLDTKTRITTGILENEDLIVVNIRPKPGKELPPQILNLDEVDLSTEILDSSQKMKARLDGAITSSFGKWVTKIKSIEGGLDLISQKDLLGLVSENKEPSEKISIKGYPNLTPSGRWALISGDGKEPPAVIDLNMKKTFQLPVLDGSRWVQVISESEAKLLCETGDYRFLVDSDSGEVKTFNKELEVQLDSRLQDWVNRDFTGYYNYEEICFPDSVRVEDQDCNCDIANQSPSTGTDRNNIRDLSMASIRALCQSEGYSDGGWQKVAPVKSEGIISRDQAEIYLMRFQKKGGFDPKKDLAVLSGILRSSMLQDTFPLVNEVFKTLALEHPELLSGIYRVFQVPHAPDEKSKDLGSLKVCRSPTEEQQVKQLSQAAKMMMTEVNKNYRSKDFLRIRPFMEEFRSLPVQQKEAMIDNIAESLSQNAGDSPNLKGVFQSKLYYFAKKFALDLFGEKPKPATDITFTPRAGKTVPILFGYGKLQTKDHNFTFENQPNNVDFGFEYKVLNPVVVPKDSKPGDLFKWQAQWSYKGEDISSEVELTVLPSIGGLIPKNKAPDYEALQRGGALTGMVVVGDNMSGSSGKVFDEYFTYLLNEGFEFDKPSTVPFAAFMKEKIQSGEVGYLVKEAHSDGDEKNLFRARSAALVVKGIRKGTGKDQEQVYLMIPSAENHSTELISNQDFGSWIRGRKDGQPLYYFNASCSSKTKVISELNAARTKNFIPIPSLSTVQEFRNGDFNGVRQILQAFRQGKDYSGIREAMKQSFNYQRGIDRFAFPDDEDYDREIRSQLDVNLDIKVEVKNSKGKPIHVDENIDH